MLESTQVEKHNEKKQEQITVFVLELKKIEIIQRLNT